MMPLSYGANTYFDDLRTALGTELTGLVAQMVTDSVSPTFANIYDTHLGDADLAFNAISIGIGSVDMEYPAHRAQPLGPIVTYLFPVDFRVMIGNRNEYQDEEKTLQLCQSVVNWFFVNRTLVDTDFKVMEIPRVTARQEFDDTDTIGGLVEMIVRADEAYTSL